MGGTAIKEGTHSSPEPRVQPRSPGCNPAEVSWPGPARLWDGDVLTATLPGGHFPTDFRRWACQAGERSACGRCRGHCGPHPRTDPGGDTQASQGSGRASLPPGLFSEYSWATPTTGHSQWAAFFSCCPAYPMMFLLWGSAQAVVDWSKLDTWSQRPPMGFSPSILNAEGAWRRDC